jgi:hypothetical protein
MKSIPMNVAHDQRQRATLHLTTVAVAALTLAALLATPARGQSPVRAWGMGGAGCAVAHGLEAVTYNPANLAFSDGSSIGLAGAAVSVENNALSLDRYNEITGTHLDAADKAALMADIPADGFSLDADVRASALGFQFGSFALTASAVGTGSGNLDKDYFDLVLNGNQVGQTVDFSNTWGEGSAMGAATVSFGTRLGTLFGSSLGAGINVRYLHGLYEMHVASAGGTLTTGMSEITADAHVATMSAEGGRGYGVDVGLALRTAGGLSVGLALENAQSSIEWDRNVEYREYRLSAADINLLNSDLDAATTDADTVYIGAPYTTALPRSARLGASTKVGAFVVAADWVQGFEDRGLTSTNPRVLAGVEWQLGFLQPRLGAATGGALGNSASAGLGVKVGFWRLDAAAVTRGGMMVGDSKGVGVAVASSLVF